MDAKHITIFLRYLPMGGIQKIAVRLANEFVKRGHTVDLVLAKGEGAMATEVHPDVRMINLNKQRVWLALPELWVYMCQNQPDSLLSFGFSANVVSICAKMMSFFRINVYVSARNNMSKFSETDEVWYSDWVTFMIQLLFPLADKVIAVSEGVLEDLRDISSRVGQRGCVIYNPVINKDILQKADETTSHPWFTEERAPVVLGVGRLTPQKNFALLLRAFNRIQQTQAVRLIILGDGNKRAQLETQIEQLELEDKVDLHGFVDNPFPFMREASLLVMSSDYEGLPSVPIQALACGCPVVSTDCPSGPREILEDGKWGRLVPVGDEEALAEAMRTSLAEEHDPERLRQRAMDFSVDNAVEQYLDVLFSGN
jgi:glycosyltransferase involved in cell wall biosynthesis